MKVSNINPILFKSNPVNTKPINKQDNQKNVTELNNVTPDFTVTTPSAYTKTGTEKLFNGLTLHSYKLANGYKVSIIPMEGSPAIVKNYVNVGSMNETDDIKGISHFLEHMAFNGTTGQNGYIKLKTGDSFKKIEALGGWTNASTSYAITDYVNSTPLLQDSDLEKQLEVIAAMTYDLALTDEMIEKEKGTVCSEINMIMDDPQTVAMDQTVRNLFNIKSSADELIAGSVQHIQNLNRQKVKEYYDKYYTPNNMNLVITGDVNPDETIKLVAKNFKSDKTPQGKLYEEKLNPIQQAVRKDIITEKADSTTMIIGFAGPENSDVKANIIYEILQQYLAETSFGMNTQMKKLNADYALGMEKISNNPKNPSLMYFMAGCANDENSEKVLKLTYDKLSSIKLDDKKIQVIKERLLQNAKKELDYSISVNSIVGQAVLNNSIEYCTNYENIINSITTKDIEEFINTYINLDKAAITVVHPKTSEEKINKNYIEAQKISFKGKNRTPLNTEKVSIETLPNNYKFAKYHTDNDLVNLGVIYEYDMPENINPAAVQILNCIYTMGTDKTTEEDFKDFNDNNNILLSSKLDKEHLAFNIQCSSENIDKAMAQLKNINNHPRIDENTFKESIRLIKENLINSPDTSEDLYLEYAEKLNATRLSKKALLKYLDTVTIEDVQNLQKHIENNSMSFAVMNVPNNNPDIEKTVVDTINSFKKVKPFEYKTKNLYIPNQKAVLTKAGKRSQADVKEIFRFEHDNSPKEIAIAHIMNTILSNSHSIGLFNTLREKEQLAYSVGSNIQFNQDIGLLSCNILTTTDDTNSENKSYDNLQKSINGFNRQIKCLLNSEYTDEDIQLAKQTLKADLLIQEGTASKLNMISNGLCSKDGINHSNYIYNEIDNITREDIDKFAQKVFSNSPVYSIVATQNTLDANAEYLKTL